MLLTLNEGKDIVYGETDTAISVFISLYVSWRD
nr:MAG TPA: hypothetical protein [Caudoviricetes sp.]